MLANGSKLEYKKGADFENIIGLKSIPEMGSDPNKIENSCLADAVKQYDLGIKDYGDLAYKFKKFPKDTPENASYEAIKALADAKTKTTFKQVLSDGSSFVFDAVPNVKLGGGELDGVIEWTLALALQSDVVEE